MSLDVLSLVTGFILYFSPHGQRTGRLIFAGVNRRALGEWHTHISVAAVVPILQYLLENRRGVSVYVKTTVGST